MDFEVLKTYKRKRITTEGLAYEHPFLYESSGRNPGLMRKMILEKGSWKTIQEVNLSEKHYGESVCVFEKHLAFLTQHGPGFIFSKSNMGIEAEFNHAQSPFDEGWGVAYDTTTNWLIISGGEDHLHFFSKDLKFLFTKEVKEDGHILQGRLNELEYAEGKIYANVSDLATIDGDILTENMIMLEIDAYSLEVTRRIDLTKLFDRVAPSIAGSKGFPQGIAYNNRSRTFYVTGKNWDIMFEIRLLPQS